MNNENIVRKIEIKKDPDIQRESEKKSVEYYGTYNQEGGFAEFDTQRTCWKEEEQTETRSNLPNEPM